METIELLPHHARQVLMAYRGMTPGNGIGYYTEELRAVDIKNIEAILGNPTQTVRIVSTLDSLCHSCPYNKFGAKYDPNLSDDYCDLGSGKVSRINDSWTEDLGLQTHIDEKPLTSAELLDTMQKNFRIYNGLMILFKTIFRNMFNNQ